MAVRLTHRQRPDLQSYTIIALGRSFAVTGQAALTLAGRKLAIPDRIPYSYSGYAATLTHGNLEPTWSSTVGTITFTQGTASTHDLTQYTTNFNPSLHQMQYASSVTAPTGVTLVSTGSYSYNGVGVAATSPNVQIEIVDTAAADWIARSTASGVVYANRLETTFSASTSTILPSVPTIVRTDQPGNITLDTSIKVAGAVGSQKFDVFNTDTTSSGTLRVYFGSLQTFGNGQTMWFSFRVRYPALHAYQPWTPGGQRGPKAAIMSHWGGSNQNNEIVPGDGYGLNEWNCYWQDGVVTAVWPNVAYSSSGNASDIRSQPSVDRGANPLTGNNPDSGSAWTLWQQQRAQYGHLYSSYSNPGAAETRLGFGDPFSGAQRMTPDVWHTVTIRTVINTFGSFNNRITMWVAPDGSQYQQIFDAQNIRLGSTSPDYNTLWLLPYVSGRAAGGRKIASRTNNITGVDLYTCGLDTPIGVGTLSWNASTQRLTWAGFGESAGTAVGFSAANNILTRNVCSGTTALSYLVAKFTPGSLPGTNQTDTITIADGRPDSYVHYNDVIISTQAINAPGGFAPT